MTVASYWIIVFAVGLGQPSTLADPKLSIGPFPEPELAYAAAALGLNELNQKNPDKDFWAALSTSPELKRQPGANLLTAQQAYELAVLKDSRGS